MMLCDLLICTSLTPVQFDFENRFLCLLSSLLICHLSLLKVTERRINKFTATAAAGSVRFPLPVLSSKRKNNLILCIIYLLYYFLIVLCRIMTMRGRNCWQPEVSAPKCLIFLLWIQELCTGFCSDN